MQRFTYPFFPSLDQYNGYLKQIWENQWLTNNGPFLQQFESKVPQTLESHPMLLVSNGTIALQIAIEALQLKGEIITTPFSYIATSSSISWQNCKPVFVDINADDYAIDPHLIESAITDKTTAILATHIFGNACDIDAIETIAKKYDLRVIYDAAHCFGTKYKDQSIFNYGDISTCSFHATKIFHTIEGGGVFTKNKQLLKQLSLLRNFGHNGPEVFDAIGINGKNSEVHAAMGLSILPHLKDILQKRKHQYQLYKSLLATTDKIKFQKINSNVDYNYAYCSIYFPKKIDFERVYHMAKTEQIGLRRYFHPSLNTIPLYVGDSCPVSEYVSSQIFCLPLYHELSDDEIQIICKKILRCL